MSPNRIRKRALAVFLFGTCLLTFINSGRGQALPVQRFDCPAPVESASAPPAHSRVHVQVGTETEAGILFRAILGDLRICSNSEIGANDLDDLDIFIIGDREGRITEESRLVLYAHSTIFIVLPNGNVRRCDETKRLPAEDLTLTQLLSSCAINEARSSPQDLIADLNAKMRIVQVPRFVEVQDGGRPYYTIASRTLAARKAVDVEPQPASAAFADAMPPNMEQELVARMGRLNWDYVLRVLFSTTKKIEIQTGEVVLANDVRGTRALTRIAYPKHDIEGYSAAVRDFIRDCIRFWDSVDREVARLENDALRARERPVEQEAGQRGATLP